MLSLASLIADVIVGLARQATRFTRSRSVEQQREESEFWGRAHMGVRRAGERCVVCEQYVERPDAQCPGPLAAARRRRAGR